MKVKKCVGCGFCCIQSPCMTCQRINGASVRVCPHLDWNGERHICKLMELDGDQGAYYREELHAGAGCCSNLNSWRLEPLKDRRPKPDVRLVILEPLFQKFIKSLSSEFMSSDKISFIILNLQSELKRDGWNDDMIEIVGKNILHIFKQNQSSFMKDFMG